MAWLRPEALQVPLCLSYVSYKLYIIYHNILCNIDIIHYKLYLSEAYIYTYTYVYIYTSYIHPKSLDFSTHRIVQPSLIFNFRTFSSLPKNLHAHYQSISILPFPQLLAATNLLPVSMVCLFWTFHINGIIQYVVFFVTGFLYLA